MKKGAEFFQQAIDKDPGYALAYSGLADCYSVLSTYVLIPPKQGWAKAKAAAAAAIALDPDLAEAHASRGFICEFSECDWVTGEKEHRRAAELNPAYWVTPYWYTLLLNALGRHAEAEQQIRLGRELEPLSPVIAFGFALHSFCTRRYAEAVEHCLKGIEIDPNHPLLHLWLGAAYEAQSRFAEAIQELETAVQLQQGSTMALGWLVHAHASAGDAARAGGLMQQLQTMAAQQPAEPFSLVIAHQGMGQPEQALECLETACETYYGLVPFVIQSDPRLDDLRAHPRFLKVLQRMRLAD